MKNTNFIQSLKHASDGIISAFLRERNLRFHFMIANLIIIFAYFYGISKVEWAILLLSIGLVFCMEMINTAVENAVDTATEAYSQTAKLAKDVAAGTVLIAAIISVAVGFILFFDVEKILCTLKYIFTTPKALIICLTAGTADLIFLLFGRKKA